MDEFTVGHGANPYEETPVEDAVRAELTRLKIHDGVMARTVIELAKSIDIGRQVPSCARELRACMAELRKANSDAPVVDSLDELQAKRNRRRASHG
jgi:bacterioferritin-associated ferredoxin